MNKIELNQVAPWTIKDRISSNSDIWNKNLAFEKGTFYAIKAISGSGKSTFINSIYGIRKDYDGSISYDGTEIKNLKDDALSGYRKEQLSIVFQDLRLFEQLTAKDNILIKSNQTELSQEQQEWTKLLSVERLLNNPCSQLSYGERQRIAIIRALSQNFDFLLLDEPFSHLDKVNGQNAYQLILEQVKKRQAALILTTLGNEDYLEAQQTLSL
jgi:putative ABC transport system ATP-binding protein